MPEDHSHFERLKLPTIVKGAGILFAGRLTARLLGYAFSLLAAKIVGLKGFGLYTLGLTVLRVMGFDFAGSQSGPVVRYISLYHAARDEARVKGTILFALKNCVLLGVLSVAAVLLFSDYLSVRIFHQPQLASVLRYLALSIPFVGLSSVLLLSTVGVQIMSFKTLTKDLLEPFVMLVVFLYLALHGFKLEALIYAYLSSAVLGFMVAYYFFAKTFAHLFRAPFSPHPEGKGTRPISESKIISRFALPLVVARTFNRIRQRGDILLLGYFMSASQVGLYAIVNKTVNALNEISASLIGVFNPMISTSFEKAALPALRSQVQIVSRWIISITFPIVLFALFHAKPILSVLGDQFLGGEQTYVILLVGFLFDMSTAPIGQVLTMSGKSRITLVNTIGIGVINLVLFLVLIPRYGIEGASLAVAVSMFLLGLVRLIEGHTIIGIQPLTPSHLKPLIASCVALMITLWIDKVLPLNKYLFIQCSLAIFFLSYLVNLILMGLDPADRFVLVKVKERFLPS
jgi:O-antigen/teichoic acid export membrane protein